MKHVSVEAFKEILQSEKDNNSVDFINVCTPAEYKEKHIPGVRSVPLDEIESHLAEFKDKQTVYVHCRGGTRSQKAIDKLAALGVKASLVNIEGGISAWESAGFGVGRLTQVKIPVMQQVLLAAGLLVLLGTLGSLVLDTRFIYLAIATGAGLTFAGYTGWCGMAYCLAKMPWNK